jgi:hypothetical protein
MLLAPVTNWEPHGATLEEYCYGTRHGMKVQLVTLYRVSQLYRNGVKFYKLLQTRNQNV